MDLGISVSDNISVREVIFEFIELVKKIWHYFFHKTESDQTDDKAEESRGPPDLGVSVEENVNTGEALS